MKKKLLGTINKRVYKSFLASYMMIFTFSLIICIAMFSVTLIRAGKQYAETGLLSVTQLQNIIDGKLDNLESVSRSILSRQQVGSIKYYSYPFSGRQMYTIRELKEHLTEEVSSNDLIKEIYLRFENSDMILSSNTIFRGSEFDSTSKNNLLINYETFLNSLVFDGLKTYYITSSDTGKEIYMVRKLTMSKPGTPSKASLIIHIDMPSFVKTLNSLSIDSDYSITISDSFDRVIMGGTTFEDAIAIDSDNSNSWVYVKALLSGKPITFMYTSAVSGWNYHFTVNIDNSPVMTAIAILLICFVISIFGGFLLCFVLAKRQYDPVDRLLTKLDVAEKEFITDEYNAITSQIEKLQLNSENAEKYSEKYYRLYRKKILTDLIQGDNVSLIERAILEDSKLLPLHSESFVLLSIFPTKIPENPVKYAGINHMEVLANSITDMVKDFFHDSATVYSVTLNHSLYLLINPTAELEDYEVSVLFKELYEIVSEIRKYVLQSLDMSLSAAVSNLRHSIRHINDAYLETESVKEIIMQNPNFSPILCYHELHRSENDVTFKSTREEDIINFVNMNFTDPDICLKNIAAKYNLSMPYISRIFKQSTGNTLSDYIHMLRLQLAKNMLTEGLTLNDTAEKCGYTNALALIRAFKKYEGMTPTEYKEKNKPSKEA